MTYFVTGATGFIGRFLVERLLQREGDIAVLVRAGSREKLSEQIERRTAATTAAGGGDPAGARIVPVVGDLSEPGSASPRRTASGCAARSTTSSTWRPSTT